MSSKKDKHIKCKSALSVNDGVEQPPSVSNDVVNKFKKIKKKHLTVSDYVDGIKNKDRTILSKAITLIESNKKEHFEIAQDIIENCLPLSGNSIRIGVTGVPGVGKSTFIESFGKKLLQQGKTIAVLAVDPSSERSKGSILGDKTRMEELSLKDDVYVRPSPSSGTLGGVARKTRETIILCEAAGFDTIIIETVGVGQSETVVHSMVDFFLLLMLAGAGDELQGIKRGIMEMADMVVINKADGGNVESANRARNEFEKALHYFPLHDSGCLPKVLTCSSINDSGINEVWEKIQNYIEHSNNNLFFDKNRNKQSIYWMYETINENLKMNFHNNPSVNKEITRLEKLVLENKMSSFVAANKLFNKYFNFK